MPKFKKGSVPWNKGMKGYQEGHPPYMCKNGEDNPFFGKKHTEETRLKMSLAKLGKRGKLANNWQGGKTQGQLIRFTADFQDWRRNILRRDSYTCAECEQVGGELNVHHIKPFADFPEDRLSEDNGITLCKKCHDKLHWRE